MRVVVIGSGIVGTSVAYECAKAGAKVVLLEAGRIAGGTSTVSFAWTNATGKRPRAYFALNVAGMRAHLELKRDFPDAPWFFQSGGFEWRTTPAGIAAFEEDVRQISEWGYGVEWVDRETVARMEPDVTATGEGPIAYFAEEGWVDPALYSAWLIRAATSRWGAEVFTGARVVAVETQNGRVVGVRTADGTQIAADHVVNCTGGLSGLELGDAPALPLASTVGVLAFTPPVALTLRSHVHADDLDMRPDGAGRIMIHKVSVDDTLSEPQTLATDGPEATALLEAARAVLTGLEMVPIEAIRSTVRPIPADGLTCAGEMPGISGYSVAVTHSGATIAPQLGKVVADEVVRGRTHAEMESFRPSRFFATGNSGTPRRAVA
ncbi:NAD(P)/FAD-dependent oxidoreductase [Acuticoccus kandeliae]|uniref:NAD(P)/FAD-dependent oxidoreductase n=1 Tax=Acuticoccus kandeliae TaxID=2073160 RepID=UPI000D3E7169|nr:FAD-binding oxidoreductase [Acuticoccus kandeliae]